ncbi:hypothetical protein [Halobacteriovorax sp. JY17]|uniref:hypothetical protein n=1 Tax=Halobacteriovorax sp. JY17 TaxID=2014617 RepID=UPI000C39F7C4|nr:hypothetical protein [Halobacteriovorax sp. JY17]PIK15305.1 MAG: hypothetical protein CES88_00920 [Halobacteriovorax sp. JY17]
MTKKKNGIFSKIKNKFSKKSDEDELENEFEDELEDEFEESTDEFSVDPEALEGQAIEEEEEDVNDVDDADEDEDSSMPPLIEEDHSEEVSFSEEQEEDDIEELLNSRSDDQTDDEEDFEEEEEFSAQEFSISDEEKEELEDLSTPLEEFHPIREEQEEDFEDDYDEDFYEEPKPSVSQRFSSFLASIKDKVPSRSSLSINRELDNDDQGISQLSEKFNLSNLSWTAFVDKVFSPDSRHDIHRGFLAFMILGTAYFGGKLVATGISSKLENSIKKNRVTALPFSPKKRVVLSKIERSNLFNTKDPNTSGEVIVEKPKLDDNLVCRTSDRKTQLGIKLVNTVVLQDSVKSIASVQVRGKDQILDLREGEKINNDAEVGKIDRLRVVFKNLKTGDCEYVENQSKEPREKNPIRVVSPSVGKGLLNKYKDDRIKNVGNTFKIQKKVRDEMLGNISEVLTQARAIQIKNPDGTLAFKMTEIVPGSIYSKLNIQEGDTITAINGKKFGSLNEIMNLFGKIKEIDRFELSVKRDGSTQNLEYNFE